MSISVVPASGFSMLPSINEGNSSAGGAQAAFAGIFSLLHGQAQTDNKANIILFTPDKNALNDFVSEFGQDADLQDLLSELNDQGLLSNSILVALTPGTPTVSTDGLNNSGIATLSLDELSILVSSNADALKNANVLLVAAPVQPANMDELAQSISSALAALKSQDGSISAGKSTGALSTDNSDIADFQVLLVRLQPVQSTEVSVASNADSSSTDPNGVEIFLSSSVEDGSGLSKEDTILDPALLSALLCGHPQDKFAPIGIVEHASDRARSVSAFASPSSGDDALSPLAPFEVAQNNTGKGTQGTSAAGTSGPQNISGTMDLDGASDTSASARFMLGGDPSQSFLDTSLSTGGLNSLNSLLQQQNTSPILHNSSAATAHTATQTVAATLTNMVQNGEIKSRQVSLELDPPELGKVQVHLSLEKGEAMKVRIVAESDDALLILKRDMHNLKQSLESAGIKMDDSSLSFDLSQGGSSFGEAMGQNQNGAQQSRQNTSFNVSGIGGSAFAADGFDDVGSSVEQTQMNIRVNPETGTVHYNILA
ncbi:MAG: flagellar hook-length control protein FliK [Pseudobdellovibrionaceae bacterium]|jgi:flagellar hook-length control protein FliK|nr:flagellar hook-length control protein FliK [Pseudobdellovibrionaceae bacterium]